jgi:hypothetical protein
MNGARFAAWIGAALVALAPLRGGAENVGDFLVPLGATWRYLANGSNQGSAWRATGFDDAAWPQGAAELGYGDGDEATVVACGPSAPACNSGNFITTYFRKSFTVSDAGSVPELSLALRRDDGAVVYLNGVEIARSNMPGGAIGHTTPASSAIGGGAESALNLFTIPASAVATGANALAVEIHQSGATSSDVSFEASLQVVAETPPGLARAPYLQNLTPASAVVRWRTTAATTTRVRWGLAAGALSNVVDVAGTRTEHEVAIGGLPSETPIFYSVGTATTALAGGDADHVFETPPPAGQRRPTRIWVIGDSGMCATSSQGCADAGAVRDGYAAYAGATPAQLWLLLGDNAYDDGTDAEFTAGFFDVYPTVMRSTPMWAVPGNHEFGSGGSDSPTQTGPYYASFTFPTAAEAGGVPSGTEAYYSFDWGNVHFVALDSHDTSRSAPANPTTNVCTPGQGGAMYQWACADLAATSADFIVALWHHPPYSKGSHDSDAESQLVEMRQRFLPVMEAFGVDLVLTGHSHSYERSVLLDGHYGASTTYSPALHAIDAGDGDPGGDGAYAKGAIGPVANGGTVNAVVGSSSQISGGALDHPVMVRSLNVLGSLLIDVDGNRLDARMIGVAGDVLDHFQIVKGPALPACSNGIDDDADGATDFPADIGCFYGPSPTENPKCDDGVDNDGDGGIDWDGGPGAGALDPQCADRPYRNSEKPGGCGLGAELALLGAFVARRRRRAAH